jgi:membrane glycosyltransferase
MAGSPDQKSGSTEQTSVVVFDDRPLPAVCVQSGEPADGHRMQAFSLREPTYRMMLLIGVIMGLFIATWMMVKVRPTITHELPAALSFTLLFLATFAPVWIVASFSSRHKGTLRLPVARQSSDEHPIQLASKGDGKLELTGVHPAFVAAVQAQVID